MRVERVECPKCHGKMEPGYVLDMAQGTSQVAQWVEGPPSRSMWTGMRTKGRRKLPIATYRCSRCGFLESFATGFA